MSRVERVEFSIQVVFGWQRAGHSGHFYKTRETGKVQKIVQEAFKKALPEGAELQLFGENVPVIVTVDTYRPLPKSKPKRVRSEPDTFKPDFDNIEKLIADALTGLAYEDDKQVVDCHTIKHPRVRDRAARTDITVCRGWDGSSREDKVNDNKEEAR